MCNTYIVRLQYTCDSFRGASDVRYSRCRNKARVDVGLSVGISITVSVSSNKVRVVVVLTKTLFRYSVSSCRQSGESQTGGGDNPGNLWVGGGGGAARFSKS